MAEDSNKETKVFRLPLYLWCWGFEHQKSREVCSYAKYPFCAACNIPGAIHWVLSIPTRQANDIKRAFYNVRLDTERSRSSESRGGGDRGRRGSSAARGGRRGHGAEPVDLFAVPGTTTTSSTTNPTEGSNVIPLFGRRGSTPPPPQQDEEEGKKLLVMQDRLVEVIDGHYNKLHESIDNLGCRGNCYSCPNPEATEHPGVKAQVKACLTAAVEGLDLDRALLNFEE